MEVDQLGPTDHARYVCTASTSRPADDSSVRWLDKREDFGLMREFWLLGGIEMSPDHLAQAEDLCYRYCSVV
jgi:hypothetical protein